MKITATIDPETDEVDIAFTGTLDGQAVSCSPGLNVSQKIIKRLSET